MAASARPAPGSNRSALTVAYDQSRTMRMFRLEPYLIRMGLFLAAGIACGLLVLPTLLRAFHSNPPLNALILAVLVFGVIYAFRQVLLLRHEAAWIETFRRGGGDRFGAPANLPQPRLLAPMVAMIGDRQEPMRLTASSMRSLLDTIVSRLDESRALARYMIGLLIFLGLLGTFWGLLLTINSISDVIHTIQPGGSDLSQMFNRLKEGLAAPLSGMGTAFGSSLFGLAGSLVLGFLDLQTGQAQNRFYNDLEEWLSGLTRLSAPSVVAAGDAAIPDYVQALLEQTAEGLDALQRTLARGEENRSHANTALIQLSEKLSTLTDHMRAEQSLLVRIGESQLELRPMLARIAQLMEHRPEALDDATRAHIRNMEVYLARLLEESASGRGQAVEELRAEIKLLSRTIAAASEKAAAARPRRITG